MKKILLLLKPLLLAIVAAVISSALPAGAQSVWNAMIGVSANTNWSTAVNWSPSGVPDASSNVLFIDPVTTAAHGMVDNVMNETGRIETQQ
jgi:hypothetical protein